MLITIINWPKDAPVIHCSGASSKEYPFAWNTKAGRYEYPPKNQAEIDDIFMSQGMGNFFFYAPVLDAGDAAGINLKPTPRPTIERRDYDDLTKPELVALAKDCGFTPRASDDEIAIKRLLDAYFLGCGMKALLPDPVKPAPVAVTSPDEDTPVETPEPPAAPEARKAPPMPARPSTPPRRTPQTAAA